MRPGSTCSGSPSCARRRSPRGARTSAAATSEPWSCETSSLSTSAERLTISRQRPSYERAPDPGAPEVRRLLERTRHVVGRGGRAGRARPGLLHARTRAVSPAGGVNGATAAPSSVIVSGTSCRSRRTVPSSPFEREDRLAVVLLDGVVGPPVVEARLEAELVVDAPPNGLHPADDLTAVVVPGMATGMKSDTSPTPSAARKRVMRMFVSGRYICLLVPPVSSRGQI